MGELERREMWWSNQPGLGFWKADSIAELAARDFKHDSIAAIERLNDLANSLAPGETSRDSWSLFPQNEPVNVSLDQTMITIENNRDAVFFQVAQFLDNDSDPQNIRLAEATRHTPVLICIFDTAGHLLAENPAVLKFRTGLRRDLKLTRTLAQHINDTRVADEIIASITKDETYRGERQEAHQDGQKHLAMIATRGRDPITAEVAIYLTEEDVTAQVQLTQQLAVLNSQLENRVTEQDVEAIQQQARYKAVFENAHDALLIRDADSLEVVAANPAASDMFLVSREDIEQNKFDPRKLKMKIEGRTDLRRVETERLLSSAENPKPLSFHSTLYRSDNQPFPALITLIPFTDSNRHLVRTSIVDLTIQRQEQARYQAIFDSAAEAIIINDIDDPLGFVEMNPQAEKLFGIKLEDLQSGKLNFYDLSPEFQPDGRDSKKVAPAYTQSALKNGSSVFEWTFFDVNGKATPCEMTVSPFPHPTKRLIRSSIVDISERKQAEATRLELETQLAQAQKLEAVGQLTGGIAHDFNNLLAVVMGNMELLLEDTDNDGARTLINRTVEAAERGARLTRSMLAFARKSDLRPEQVNLADAIIDLERWVGNTIADNINVSADMDEDLWPVHIDLAGFERSLLNLVINARDALSDGGSLTIRATNLDIDQVPTNLALKAGRHVALTLIDDGSGIEPHVLKRVFDPFFTTKNASQNSGLGLSMVHGFMTQSGGAVGIDSEVGTGTMITLYFPVDTANKMLKQENPPEVEVKTQALKILLVEDQKPVLEVITKILTKEGHQVTPSSSGDSALKIFENETGYDLLITDIDMPGELQGPQLAARVHERDSSLPIIFLSGHNIEIEQDPQNTKTQQLMKPLSRQDLVQAIFQAVS